MKVNVRRDQQRNKKLHGVFLSFLNGWYLWLNLEHKLSYSRTTEQAKNIHSLK